MQLSSREVEILQQLADGQTVKQVASAMVLSTRIIERATQAMRLKMSARNTTHLITRAFQSGALRGS
jgi:DNA-binding NarL/FixJ family response regulator